MKHYNTWDKRIAWLTEEAKNNKACGVCVDESVLLTALDLVQDVGYTYSSALALALDINSQVYNIPKPPYYKELKS